MLGSQKVVHFPSEVPRLRPREEGKHGGLRSDGAGVDAGTAARWLGYSRLRPPVNLRFPWSRTDSPTSQSLRETGPRAAHVHSTWAPWMPSSCWFSSGGLGTWILLSESPGVSLVDHLPPLTSSL